MTIMRVYAMARPRRPLSERDAVRAAAGVSGSVTCRATALARRVAAATIAEIDRPHAERILSLLNAMTGDPVTALATDAEIDTAALVVAARTRRLEARGGRRLPEAGWANEDREIAAEVAHVLARRYRAHLVDC
ncbi:hypothetical protein [Sphingomonas qomolangmaensis]|uniref:Uncharacterized protein n=1 Tax=Sphingomonas qomolangmaensis TaxID=2918765 RepID=A0ABY5LC25_9SPHN|nr:hypothetical protein [Sphingomonas qomolangmaensis]UUL82231.1 hypothetical protein NMP03_13745 [Sphingomonas qomolangmaensis]